MTSIHTLEQLLFSRGKSHLLLKNKTVNLIQIIHSQYEHLLSTYHPSARNSRQSHQSATPSSSFAVPVTKQTKKHPPIGIEFNVAEGISAYFISDSNKIIQVRTTHIDHVWMNPEYFGFTRAYMEQLHNKHSERYGTEGVSRAIILTKMLQNNWIKVRQHKNTIVLEIWALTPKIKRNINRFIMLLLDNKLINEYTEFRINTLNNKTSTSSSAVTN